MITFRSNPLCRILVILAACAMASSAVAAEKPAAVAEKPKADANGKPGKASRFIRVLRDDEEVPQELQTAVVRYVPATGNKPLQVDLVAAVHVGDTSYYDELNKRFKKYDVVLYELVAPKGTRIGKDERKNSPLAGILKNLLKLESQVQQIDYTRQNFVHADMSPDEMAKAMKKRGQTGFSLALTIFTDLMRQQKRREQQLKKQGKELPTISPLTLLFDPKRSLKLKRYMAEEFDTQDPSAALGQTLNVMLVRDRNKAALKVLSKQIKQGKHRIAIFYGAAHMPDFEQRLQDDFGLKRKSVEWISAWDLSE